MRPIGFSTGALAYADFRKGLEMTRGAQCGVVELSALRESELTPLMEALGDLDLSGFSYVSVHVPSQYAPERETGIATQLRAATERGWPLIVHPDAITDFGPWRELGPLVCLENMDKRKPIGRSAKELESIFHKLPQAGLCLDIGHAKQVDATMGEAFAILREFGDRLKQLHVSEVNTRSRHDRLSYGSILAFRLLADSIPTGVPLILETPVQEEQMAAEIERVREALPEPSRLAPVAGRRLAETEA